MTRSRLRRAGAAVFALALGAVGLAGCEFSASGGAHCSTQPLVPHHELGVVGAAIDVPWVLHPGERFTVTVNDLGSSPGDSPSLGTLRSGALTVEGPVTPSGSFAVGERLVGATIEGSPYPNTLDFEVTGQPGESVAFSVQVGTSFQGQFPSNGFFLRCSTPEPVEIVRVQIVAPQDGDG
jgi:hypothetical protein